MDIGLHHSVCVMNNSAAKNYMAYDALVNKHSSLQLYLNVATLALSLCGKTGYRGTSLRTSHSNRAYADTRAQHPTTSQLPTSFISYRSPSACFASIYTLILLLNWNKSGGALTQHEQFLRGFFFSFWMKEMHLILGLSNYHPADTSTYPWCAWYIHSLRNEYVLVGVSSLNDFWTNCYHFLKLGKS
jgi:hypothetical protein